MRRLLQHLIGPDFKTFLLIALGFACIGPAAAQDAIRNVQAQNGKELQSIAPSYWVEFDLWGGWSNAHQESLGSILRNSIANGWKCRDPQSYGVVETGSKATVIVQSVSFRTKSDQTITTCQGLSDYIRDHDPYLNLSIILYVVENQPIWQTIDGSITVEMKKLQDSQKTAVALKSSGKGAPVKWKPTVVTVAAASLSNEKLIDKTIYKNAVYQFPVSSTLPLFANRWGGLFVETKSTFSTNERDSKSAFMGGLGYQVGLSPRWTIPLKLEQQVTGNQVATNLSAVSTAQVSTTLPWTGRLTPGVPIPTGKDDEDAKREAAEERAAWHDLPAVDTAPALCVAFPYTHRINQYVAPKSSPLPAEDFAVNPFMALSNERLLNFWHPRVKGSTKPVYSPSDRIPPFTFQWEANWGMYYLPLEKTAKGTARAEGTGDVSVLIPISNFGVIPGVALDPKTQSNQMQLRIKWQDSVSATNNYVRTKGWTFGLELAVKK